MPSIFTDISQAATAKKSSANLNNAGATPAATDGDGQQEPPTPATPITPVNPASFAKNQNVNAAQVVPNGQPAAQAPPPVTAVPPPQHPGQDRTNNFMETGGLVSWERGAIHHTQANTMQDFSMDFANPLTSGDVLSEFDFDSFLHDSNNGEETFDFGANFIEGNEIGAE